jgi:hypothetical protein
MECEEELCSECTEYHTALKATRNHHVVDLKVKTSYSSLLKKPSLFYEKHKECEVEYFCVDHDELCCRDYLSIFRHSRKDCLSDPCSKINNISLRYNSTSSVTSNTLEILSCWNFMSSWTNISNLLVSSFYSALLKKSSLVCEQHKDCDVEYFCLDHDELCCRECLAKTHKSCVNTMSVDSASKGEYI